ncbi:uncharacterized protein A4U43_C01F14180 [Asparagus officinalis]|uniref:Uncharacterized protein n=1 Tax=Asparagus officinalis TaxID=4686 RepID=A0A5P1FSZ6_ASPOF|nr:uncharacterized protein A4U43_C01F14180 [Asparagus officinalis]
MRERERVVAAATELSGRRRGSRGGDERSRESGGIGDGRELDEGSRESGGDEVAAKEAGTERRYGHGLSRSRHRCIASTAQARQPGARRQMRARIGLTARRQGAERWRPLGPRPS